MRIHTRVVIDMRTDAVLEDDSFEHRGPVALCKGGGEIEETPEEKELARIAEEQWERYQTELAPIENKFYETARVSQGDRNQVTGQTAASVMGALDGQADAAVRNRMVSGGPSGGGAFNAGLMDAAVKQGATVADATSSANERASNQDVIARQDFVAIGRGQADQAQFGLAQEAGRAADEAIDRANSRFNTNSARGAAIGMAAGAAGRYGLEQAKTKPEED